MQADKRFKDLPKEFWENVRSISEELGYTSRSGQDKGQVKTPTLDEMINALQARSLKSLHLITNDKSPTQFGQTLMDYYEYRSDILNVYVEPRLMDVNRAKDVFEALYEQYRPKCPIPMNKQKNEKKAPAYFTGIINILIEANITNFQCDYDPRKLTTVTHDEKPLRTLARRVDGAFPSTVNPIAIWEIKEYYYTTTFGSRVADSIYETLLDGMELEELWQNEKIKVKHYMMIDAYLTWWTQGKSYLCRIIDLLHMGYIEEVLFGYEVVEKLPNIVKEWLQGLK